ncbi:MAG: RiPP maturation radical SAM C-methyltransferase [Deltaproteobacteria bacterium]|nr:RiPP maturation radical SAM C-methyltransferase [Deltaproteobacteria bacterium]
MKSIALISTPWPLFSRPSIQLGALKSYLTREIPDLDVKAYHFYLKIAALIGYPLYREISEKTWLAEAVYAALLYPERFDTIEKLFYRKARGKPLPADFDFKELTQQVAGVTDEFINGVDWDSFCLAGFSICFCQLTSSLYFIQNIKKKCPGLEVVVGGSMFAGDSIKDLFRVFPEIDFVINGEGELPLSRLVHHLLNSSGLEEIARIPGLVTPRVMDDKTGVVFNQLSDLGDLPVPDYDDYFRLLKTFSAEKTFFPTLPAEASRGCRWQTSGSKAAHSGCAFCNLNRNWKGYRCKRPEQVAAEIEHLTSKYRNLSVAFMDNLMPIKTAMEMFGQLAGLKKDLSLFCELRATTPKRVLEKMGSAGVNKVQIGIEALSSRLLEKLNKGTTAIQNLEIMKHCEGLGIVNNANLILRFPGSDVEDIKETLQNLEFAAFFRPLRLVHFWLGQESPVYESPEAFGVRAVFNHPNYAKIFPMDVCRHLTFLIQGYRGDMGHQKKLWRPVEQKVRAWQEAYTRIHRDGGNAPILSYRDGRDFMIIRQQRFEGEPFTHRLEGLSRKIYLFCGRHRSFTRILYQFQGLTEDRLMPFLQMMTDKKLMFEENRKYLSLAVPISQKNGL